MTTFLSFIAGSFIGYILAEIAIQLAKKFNHNLKQFAAHKIRKMQHEIRLRSYGLDPQERPKLILGTYILS